MSTDTKSYFCSAPWVNVTIMENGDVRTCCAGKSIGNINKQSIYDIVKSSYLLKTKQDILNNTPTDNCKLCYQQEQQTGTSLRFDYNNCYPNIDQGLQALDLRRSNLCNLTCIYCGPQISSSWADRLNQTVVSFKNNYNSNLEKWLLTNLETVQEITLMGGEPLLMKENYTLIDNINDQIRLSITTNLTIDLERLPIKQTLLEKSNIIWNVSADNYGQRFEYVRNGADWNQFKKNLQLLIDHGKEVSILLTYGIFSGLSLLDTVKYYHSIGVDRFIIGSVIGHPVLDIFNYPSPVLEKAYQEIQEVIDWQKNTFGEKYGDYQIISIDSYAERLYNKFNMTNTSRITRNTFLTAISSYDKFTKDKFSELWADEYKLIIESIND